MADEQTPQQPQAPPQLPPVTTLPQGQAPKIDSVQHPDQGAR